MNSGISEKIRCNNKSGQERKNQSGLHLNLEGYD